MFAVDGGGTGLTNAMKKPANPKLAKKKDSGTKPVCTIFPKDVTGEQILARLGIVQNVDINCTWGSHSWPSANRND